MSQLLYDVREFGTTSREPSALASELAAIVGPLASNPGFKGADLLSQS